MAESESSTVHVALPYPHDRLEHGVKGVEPITRDGVDIPKSKLNELKKAAQPFGIELVED